MKLMFVDVKNSHVNAKCEERNGSNCRLSSRSSAGTPSYRDSRTA